MVNRKGGNCHALLLEDSGALCQLFRALKLYDSHNSTAIKCNNLPSPQGPQRDNSSQGWINQLRQILVGHSLGPKT